MGITYNQANLKNATSGITLSPTPGTSVAIGLTADHFITAAWTAAQNTTVTFTGTPFTGQQVTLVIANDASLGRTMTFSGIKSTATIVGTVSKKAVIRFVYDGTDWCEVSRTLLL